MTTILHAMLGKAYGGLEKVFLDDQPLLERSGARVVAVARAGAEIARRAGFPLRLTPAFTDWDPISKAGARALVREVRPDLIVAHGQRAWRLFAAAAPPPAPLALVVHKPRFDLEMARTHYWCVSEHLAALVRARGAPSERVRAIANAVAIPEAAAAPFAGPGPVRIRAAGRLHPKKGFDLLIDAIAMLRAEGLAVACEIAGEGEERGALEQRVAAAGLAETVRLVGWREDVAAFLAGADVFAFPSRQEGMPLVLMEAMAAGVPCVAAAIDGVTGLIRDGETGFLTPPDDAAGLAAALKRRIQEPEAARRVAEAARADMRAAYGPQARAARLAAAVEAALGMVNQSESG